MVRKYETEFGEFPVRDVINTAKSIEIWLATRFGQLIMSKMCKGIMIL